MTFRTQLLIYQIEKQIENTYGSVRPKKYEKMHKINLKLKPFIIEKIIDWYLPAKTALQNTAKMIKIFIVSIKWLKISKFGQKTNFVFKIDVNTDEYEVRLNMAHFNSLTIIHKFDSLIRFKWFF